MLRLFIPLFLVLILRSFASQKNFVSLAFFISFYKLILSNAKVRSKEYTPWLCISTNNIHY